MRVLILFRRQADDALERALQVRRADTRVRRELGERHGAIGVRVEIVACALDRLLVRGFARARAWVATPAGAIARRSASSGWLKKLTFSRSGRRDGHDGRQ